MKKLWRDYSWFFIVGALCCALVLVVACTRGNDTPTPSPQPSAQKVITGKSKQIIMSVGRHSFMSGAIGHDGTPYGGTYSEPSKTSLIRNANGTVMGVPCGESLFDFVPIPGRPNWFLGGCEGARGIAGSAWHFNVKTKQRKLLYTLDGGLHSGAFGVNIINGDQFVVGGTEMSVNGKRAHKWDKRYYVKHVFKFQGRYYIPGYDTSKGYGGWFVSDRAVGGYRWKNVKKHARFMFGQPRPDGKALALVGTDDYSGGDHHRNSATLWIYKAGKLHKIKTFNGFDFIPQCHWFSNSQLLFPLTVRWNGKSGDSGLGSYWAGKASVIARFDEPEARMVLKAKSGNAIVWTRWDKVRGRAYLVK